MTEFAIIAVIVLFAASVLVAAWWGTRNHDKINQAVQDVKKGANEVGKL